MMRTTAVLIVAAVAIAAAAGVRAESTSRVIVAKLDAGTLKGEPSRLAWAPDGASLYVQSIERDRYGTPKATSHFIVSVNDHSVKRVDVEPDWASAYWSWKSGQTSPASRAARIDVETKQQSLRSTSAPTGGDLARGGTDQGAASGLSNDLASAAYQTQTSTSYTLKWNGHTIGEWMNEPVVPGSNFSWAPAPALALAFAPRDGSAIEILGAEGQIATVAGSRSAMLPAWSPDGTTLAWLEHRDKKHYELLTAHVTPPR